MDRVDKLPIHAQQGVEHTWLIDPDTQTLEVLALRDAHWVLLEAYKADAEVCGPPFEVVRFGLAGLWA